MATSSEDGSSRKSHLLCQSAVETGVDLFGRLWYVDSGRCARVLPSSKCELREVRLHARAREVPSVPSRCHGGWTTKRLFTLPRFRPTASRPEFPVIFPDSSSFGFGPAGRDCIRGRHCQNLGGQVHSSGLPAFSIILFYIHVITQNRHLQADFERAGSRMSFLVSVCTGTAVAGTTSPSSGLHFPLMVALLQHALCHPQDH